MDNSDLYQTMYGQVAHEGAESPPGLHPDHPKNVKLEDSKLVSHRRSSVVQIEGAAVEVPNMAYVGELERRLDEMHRLVRRHETQLRQFRKMLQNHGGEMKDLWAELETKLDGRR